LDDASFKQFLIILQQAQCDGPTQIKVTRNLAAWSLNGKRSQQMCSNDTVQIVDDLFLLGGSDHKHSEVFKLPPPLFIEFVSACQFLTSSFGTIALF